MAEVKKRSLFSKFFGTKENKTIGTKLEFLNSGYNATFTDFNGKLYDTTQVRTCIDAIAKNGAKLNPKHIRSTDKKYQIKNDNLIRIISEQPNELMNAYDFYYKIISQLYLNNNAFIYIQRDANKNVTGLYPIKSDSYKLLEYKNNVYIQFNFSNGKFYTASLQDDIIHLKRFYCENDILGGDSKPIIKTMSFKQIVQDGVINAIKTTQGIKGYLKTTKAMLKPEDIKETRDKFVEDFVNSSSGIAGLDATTDFKEVNINPQTATDSQVNSINKEIKDYFGVSDEIIQSKYNEEQWNAFYESVLEPIGIMLSLEFTNKIFTIGERFHGNKIVFEANRLQYASNNTKINIIKEAGAMGILTINEAREILNLPPVDDGEKRLQSLNYVDSKIANQYQLDNEKPNEEGGENE